MVNAGQKIHTWSISDSQRNSERSTTSEGKKIQTYPEILSSFMGAPTEIVDTSFYQAGNIIQTRKYSPKVEIFAPFQSYHSKRKESSKKDIIELRGQKITLRGCFRSNQHFPPFDKWVFPKNRGTVPQNHPF